MCNVFVQQRAYHGLTIIACYSAEEPFSPFFIYLIKLLINSNNSKTAISPTRAIKSSWPEGRNTKVIRRMSQSISCRRNYDRKPAPRRQKKKYGVNYTYRYMKFKLIYFTPRPDWLAWKTWKTSFWLSCLRCAHAYRPDRYAMQYRNLICAIIVQYWVHVHVHVLV